MVTMEDILCEEAIYCIFSQVMNLGQPIFQSMVAHCAYLLIKKAESEHKFVVFYVLSCFFLFICFWNTMCKSLALSLLYSLSCSWFHSSSALASWVLGYMPDWRMWVSCYIINLTIFSCISFKQFICSIKICLRFY